MRSLARPCVTHRRRAVIVQLVSLGPLTSVRPVHLQSTTKSSHANTLFPASAPQVSGITVQVVSAASGGDKFTDHTTPGDAI